MNKPKIVFSDFDGTLTSKEELSPVFFDILAILKKHDIPLIVTTGRSVSWAHFLLTHLGQLKFAITEGGGQLTIKEGCSHDIADINLCSESDIEVLEKVSEKLLSDYPGLLLTTDSFGRRSDRAIDLTTLEDQSLKSSIESFLKDNGISFSSSSVHLNFWKGHFSKRTAIDYVLKNYFKDVSIEECFYFGDSLNDQSAFNSNIHSVGVSNLSLVEKQLRHLPKVFLKGKENAGPLGVLNYLESVLK